MLALGLVPGFFASAYLNGFLPSLFQDPGTIAQSYSAG